MKLFARIMSVWCWLWLAASAAAQVEIPLTVEVNPLHVRRDTWSPNVGTGYVTRGLHPVEQLVIPRNPGGQDQSALPIDQNHCWGPTRPLYGESWASSVIQGTVENPGAAEPIVVTEDFDDCWAASAGPSNAHPPAVLGVVVHDLTILGPPIGGGSFANQDYTSQGYVHPTLNNSGAPTYYNDVDRWHGLFIASTGARVENVGLSYIAGTALHLKGGFAGGGANRWYDRLKPYVGNLHIRRAFRGFEYEYTDGVLGTCDITDCRDWGLKLTGSAINVVSQVHSWGIITDDPDRVANGTEAKAIWLAVGSDDTYGGPWYGDNSQIGMQVDSHGSILHSLHFRGNTDVSLRVAGNGNTFNGILVAAGSTNPIGIKNSGQGNLFDAATIASPTGGTCIQLAGNTGAFRTKITRGVLIVGDSGKGISVTGALRNSRIEANINAASGGSNGAVGIDFTGGSIGPNNVIELTFGDISGGTLPQTLATLPVGWSTTPKNTTSRVFIQGRQYYPPNDEF